MRMFILLFVLITLRACESRSGHRKRIPPIVQMSSTVPTRVKIIENGTISYVNLTPEEEKVYRPADTVWVNLETHKVDDTCSTTMKGVILLTTTK